MIRGITRSVGNEIDEFITGGMQNNLVGLPLDIGAINIARGRDVGTPGLNAARRAFHAASQDTSVAPYANWVDYADNLRHELSIVNFIAAYGTHPTVAGGDGIPGNYSDGEPNAVEDRRKAACALVSAINVNPSFCVDAGFDVEPAAAAPADAEAFMRSQGDWATGLDGLPITGLEEIDFWNGGLSEERRPFTGYLGSTHNFVFESQMEDLQNGDRFYYLGRTATIHMLGALESNSFASLVMRNTDLGELGAGSVPLNLFSVPNHNLEVVQDQQFNGVDSADPEAEAELVDLVIRDPNQATTNISVADPDLFLQYTGGDHVTMGGTPGRDTMIGGIGDDAIWGREGDDRIEGGDGADLIEGGPGDDIITDLSGPDVIEGGPGNDAISSGNEEDVIFGDQGSDFIINQSEFGEIFGGLDNDFIYDGMFIGHIRGGAGDDWMENLGGGEDLWQGDDGAAPEAGEPAVKGNDVFIAYGGNNDADMENGDDIIVDGAGIDRAEGQLGFDWISFANDEFGVNVDLDLTIFLRPILPPSNSSIQNRYDRVEGLSGSPLGDILRGTPNQLGADDGDALSISTDAAGRTTTDGFSLIEGYDDTATALALVPEVERTDLNPDPVTGDAQFGWSNGDIVLGGGASDLMIGEAGDDILDGDSSLKVNIETPNPGLRTGSLNAAALVTQEALDVAIAEYQSGFSNSILAEAEAAIAVDGLDALLAQLTAQQIADLLAVEQALLASNEAAALAAAAQATEVAAAVEAAALQSVANNAAANVQAAQVHVEAETAAVMANNQAVVDTQAALGAAQESLQNAEAAVLVADANVVSATQAHAAAEQAAVDALLDQINCEVDCEAVVAVFDVAVAETITSLAERQAAEAVASIAAQAVVQA
ncbi:MAG: hypothetical protein HRU01_14445, partial [Myxococcales bacterium]|nr:hypothetical protein [Myxococcales bacterium]